MNTIASQKFEGLEQPIVLMRLLTGGLTADGLLIMANESLNANGIKSNVVHARRENPAQGAGYKAAFLKGGCLAPYFTVSA